MVNLRRKRKFPRPFLIREVQESLLEREVTRFCQFIQKVSPDLSPFTCFSLRVCVDCLDCSDVDSLILQWSFSFLSAGILRFWGSTRCWAANLGVRRAPSPFHHKCNSWFVQKGAWIVVFGLGIFHSFWYGNCLYWLISLFYRSFHCPFAIRRS